MNLEAYIDEAGSMGLAHRLDGSRDDEIAVMAAVVFNVQDMTNAIMEFSKLKSDLRNLLGESGNLHVTDLFNLKEKNEQVFAFQKRSTDLLLRSKPLIFYSARRLKLTRLKYERDKEMRLKATAFKRNFIPSGLSRPWSLTVEEDLIDNLLTILDIQTQTRPSRFFGDAQKIDLKFDQIDKSLADIYKKRVKNLQTRSLKKVVVSGYDTKEKMTKTYSSKISFSDPLAGIAGAPQQNAIALGTLDVVGKEHPLILAADIAANTIYRSLTELPKNAALNQRSSVATCILNSIIDVSPFPSVDDII